VNGKYNKPHCFRNAKKSPHQYTANSSSWMTSVTFEEFLVQLDHHRGAKNTKFLFFIEQCVAHPRGNTARKNTEVVFSPQIAQAICSHWIRGSSILSNASTESNSYGTQ